MKTALWLCVSVSFAVALSAQAKSGSPTKPRQPGTRIGPHRLGETFDEWLSIEKIDLDAVCTSGSCVIDPPDHPSNDEFLKYLEERPRSQEDAYLCDDLKPIRITGNDDYEDRRGIGRNNGYVDRWTFANGKLVGKQSIYTTEIAAKELGFLKEAYGPPASMTKLPQQNAFGAKWNDILITWHLPARAILYMKACGGPKDDLIITFISRDYAKTPVSREPNPYLSNKP